MGAAARVPEGKSMTTSTNVTGPEYISRMVPYTLTVGEERRYPKRPSLCRPRNPRPSTPVDTNPERKEAQP